MSSGQGAVVDRGCSFEVPNTEAGGEIRVIQVFFPLFPPQDRGIKIPRQLGRGPSSFIPVEEVSCLACGDLIFFCQVWYNNCG